jgi:hypothetical protein
LAYDGVNEREGGGGNQMNRPPLRLPLFRTPIHDFVRHSSLMVALRREPLPPPDWISRNERLWNGRFRRKAVVHAQAAFRDRQVIGKKRARGLTDRLFIQRSQFAD